MRLLGTWLVLVGVMRLWTVWFSFFDGSVLRLAYFPDMTDLHGRTFGTWTLLTCTLYFMTGSNLQNKPLYCTTILSLVYNLAHLLSEQYFFKTLPLCGLVTTALIAGITIVWMLLEWNKADNSRIVKRAQL